MAKPSDHGIQLKRWLAGEARFDVSPYLRTLPDDIDVDDAVRAMMTLFDRHSAFQFGKCCKKLPPPVIRHFLAQPCGDPKHLFLRLAVVDEPARIAVTWEHAVQTLLDLDLTYAWGSKPRKERFARIAADPHVLQAIQGTVAHSKEVSRDMLAVLVTDGSDASVDALVPHLDAALHGKDRRLERLTDLRVHAKRTPALDALIAEVDATLDERNAASPALALGPVIGIGHVEPLFFWAQVSCTSAQVQVNVDSRSERWFHATMWRDGKMLQCDDPLALPAWLAQLEGDLGVRWTLAQLVTSNLRGKKRDAVGRWLLSLSATTRG